MLFAIIAVAPKPRRRGAPLLLEHVERVDRLQHEERRPARHKLERLLGRRLTRLLLFALTGDHAPRPRLRRRRRVSSSP